MMRYFGMGVLFLACALLSAQFSRFQRQRLSECEGLLQLLRHIKSEIALYLRPYPECVSRFENEALAKTGFVEAMKEKGSLADAWTHTCKNFVLNGSICQEFYTFCQRFGKGYAEDEEKLLTNYIEKFESAFEKERTEMPRTAKLVRTLLASGGCAVVVLLL